jgi:hypothetical protein
MGHCNASEESARSQKSTGRIPAAKWDFGPMAESNALVIPHCPQQGKNSRSVGRIYFDDLHLKEGETQHFSSWLISRNRVRYDRCLQ